MTSIRNNKVFMACLYVLVFLLLAEWLTPVIALTNTGYQPLFLLFILLALLLAFLKIPWWISGTVKTGYILWFIVYVYTGAVFFTDEARAFLGSDFRQNFHALATQNWAQTTDVFRTLLFFALLWMAVYLIHYWVNYRLSIFLFYFLTVVFIAVLDTFSPYSGNVAIIRIMVIGLLLAGLLHLARWMETHLVAVRMEKLVAYLVPLFVMIAASAALALYLPKAEPAWPDPVPFITSLSGQGGAGAGSGTASIGRIGYGVDDTQLGGSFIGDSTPVFRAEVDSGQYWKIESKDTYTTKGWVSADNVGELTVHGNGQTVDTGFSPGDPEEMETALLAMEEEFPFVLYPYGTASFVMDQPVNYQYNTADQRFETFRQGEVVEPAVYEISFSEPSFSLTALRATSTEDLAQLPAEFERYRQLPEELPQRVRDLAVEITENSTSVYDKTRAIERYFRNNGFEYSNTDIPVPAENQDYVDQFLFETKRGYCDNYSTSMVVLLRAIDIPARWVKGFNQGDELNTTDGSSVYQVTNNNAHSWVEAYMPGIGWMLFEPTIGFTGPSNVEFDLDLETTEPTDPEMPESPTPELEEETEEDNTAVGQKGPSFGAWLFQFIGENLWKMIWSLVGLSVLSALLYKFRQKWMPKVLIPYYRMRGGDNLSFEKAYLRLLKQMDLYGIKRAEGQTLRSYANYIDSFFGTKDMSRLTTAYEQVLYGGSAESIKWGELKESWENLINLTSG